MGLSITFRRHLWLFIILTVVIMSIGMFFQPHPLIDHPQFDHQPVFNEFADIIRQKISENPVQGLFYYGFFLIDLIWAPIGLALVYRWVARMLVNERFWRHFRRSLILVIAVAYLFDITENTYYTFLSEELIPGISIGFMISMKKSFYGLTLLHLLVALYQRYFIPYKNKIWIFLKASFLSLIIVLILGALLTQMDQGATVLVDLFYDPVNIIVAFLLLNVLAMACSHFPDYIQAFLHDPPSIQWHLTPVIKPLKYMGLGLITYSKTTVADLKEQAVYRQTSGLTLFDHLRKNLGALFLFTWVYILVYILELYVIPGFPVTLFMLILFIAGAHFYLRSVQVKEEWQLFFKNRQYDVSTIAKTLQEPDSIHTDKDQDALVHELNNILPLSAKWWLKGTLIGFGLLLIMIALTAVLAHNFGWSPYTWLALLTSSLVNLIVFILFRSFRTMFSYYHPPTWLRWTGLHLLSNDIRYVGFFSIIGYMSLGVFLYAHIYPARINALVLILSWLYLLYGIVIIPLKHRFYYTKTEIPETTFAKYGTSTFFRYYLGFVVLLLIGYAVLMGQRGNHLHYLREVPENSERLTEMDTFIGQLEGNLIESGQPVRLLASYGGGLRANLWTQLLLDRMQARNDSIFHTMVAMSGVSGGFLGISLYTATRHEHQNSKQCEAIIESLGTHNFLTSDLAYLLGFDLLRELVPRDRPFNHPDRAGRSMLEYSKVITGKNKEEGSMLNRSSFREYWSQVFDSTGYWPALIGNTTGTHGSYGVAFSVKKDSLGSLFPGADDILDLANDNTNLQFLDVVSTTNRFPVFSPTAQIPGKGHYLDGGYFENSGLLSLVNFYEYISTRYPEIDSLSNENGEQVIQIINSREAYIDQLLSYYNDGKRVEPTGEIGAIIQTITSISILPEALESKYKQNFSDSTANFIQIYLPYPLSYSEVEKSMNGQPLDPIAVYDLIQDSNRLIKETLDTYYKDRWGMVAPPLARILSVPAYRYLEAMLDHPEVRAAIDRIKSK